MLPEQVNAPTPVQPDAAAVVPLWERKGIWIPLAVVLVLGVAYFVVQNQSSTATTDVAIPPNVPGTPAPAAQEQTTETELWVVTANLNQPDSVFIAMPSDYVPLTVEAVAKTVGYAKAFAVLVHVPMGIKIGHSQVSSTDPNTFFVIAIDQKGEEYAYVLNIQLKTFTKLFSSIEHPDFKNAGIRSHSPDDKIILFAIKRSEFEASGDKVIFNVSQDMYKNLGMIAAFQWTTNGNFKYKSVPKGCESYFPDPFAPESSDASCNNQIVAASWIQGSW